jgi:HK97 family phage portal protein
VKYPAKDVIHFLIPDPDNNIEGRATVAAFNHTLEIDFYQNQYQRNFYLNDASLGMILETESELGDEQYERLSQLIKDNYESYKNTGKTLILDSGMKAKQYNNSPKDVEILPARKMIRDEIMTVFGVPKVILGITDDVNRANARESLKVFNDYVIKPFAKIFIESKLNIFLEENYKDERLFIMAEYEFEIDRELQLKAYDLYRKYDIASIDEIRAMEGFDYPNNKK